MFFKNKGVDGVLIAGDLQENTDLDTAIENIEEVTEAVEETTEEVFKAFICDSIRSNALLRKWSTIISGINIPTGIKATKTNARIPATTRNQIFPPLQTASA